jgi:uncharacterized protein (DUF305 family)
MPFGLRLATAAVAIAGSLAMGACAGSDAPTGPSTAPSTARAATMGAPAPDRATARWETRFLQDMIDHHMMAVMTAEVCVEQAVHEELRQLCENIIAAQSAEIREMQRWLRQWYGVRYEPRMTSGMEREVERLASLGGAEFEIAFMEMMIRHHEAAIREAEECLDRAYHTELRQLCENIIATQSAEIEQMQSWLCEWYGECTTR